MVHMERRGLRAMSVSRRGVVVGAVASVGLGGAAGARQAASPVAVDLEAFRAVCLTVTGADALDDAGLEQLLGLIQADADMADALPTLLAAGVQDGFKLWDFELEEVVVMTAILQFWYLGEFRNAPVANREQRVGRLVSYQALPYFTAQGVCKAFGYWAEDPGV